VKQVFHPADNRFLVAAAGNDGTRGIHARCVVQPQVDEYFTIKLGDGGIHSLLVEFWYREGPVPLTFNVELLPPKRPAMFPPVQLLAGQAQGNFMQVLVNGMGVAVGSLCWSDPYPQGLRCTTLALKINPRGSPVAPFAGNCCLHDCKVQVSVSGGPTTVNAWIAVQEPDESAWFLAGNRDGSVRVPATAETSLSVGAVLANRQPWAGTAVGPAFDYGANAFLGSPNVPVLSHLGGHQGRFGTSFAAPRVTADAAALITGDRTRRFPDVRALVDQLSKQPGAVWHPRLGYACLA
jgi:hypothetical protein